MSEALRRLIRLQEVMASSEALAERIAAVPAEVARLEKDLLAAEERAEKERATLKELQSGRRRLENDLVGIEGKIAKYQSQLSDVKTNKEYQAILKEIETFKAERAALDEKILVEMEEGERRNAGARAFEDALSQKKRATTEGKAALDALVADLKRQRAALEVERKEMAAAVPRDYLDPFLKVAKQRRGVALVPVREGLCGGCHVRVMPTLIQQVRRATGLIACDSCKRFLYVTDEPARETAPGAGREAP